MSLLRFLERFKKQKKAKYLLYGDDDFLFLEAIDLVRSSIPPDERIFSLEIHDCGKTEGFVSILESLRTPSFFGKEKTFVIDNLQTLKNDEIKRLASLLEEIGDTSIVLLYRNKDTHSVRNILNMAIQIQLNLYEKEVPQWFKRRASMYGINLSDEAINYIIEFTGSEPALLLCELLKLYSTGETGFDLQEIKDLLTSYSDYDLNDLIKEIKKKNRREVIKIIRSINMEPEIIIGALNRYFSSTPDYQKIIESLFELTIKAKLHREYFDLSLIRLLEN